MRDETNNLSDIFEKIHQDVWVFLHPHPEPRVAEDLPVGPGLMQSQHPQLPSLVPVGGDEEVSDHLPTEIQLPHLESEEVHEAGQEILVPGPSEHQDVRVLPQLELSSVDKLDDGGQALLVDLLDEDLALAGLLHVCEDAGPEHRGPGTEDSLVNPEALGLTPDGEVSCGLIIQDGLPEAGEGLRAAELQFGLTSGPNMNECQRRGRHTIEDLLFNNNITWSSHPQQCPPWCAE